MRHPTAEQAAARRAAYRGRAVRVQKAQPTMDERVHVRRMQERVAVGAERRVRLLIRKDYENVWLGRHGRI